MATLHLEIVTPMGAKATADIAMATGRKEVSVRAQLHRARDELKRLLGEF